MSSANGSTSEESQIRALTEAMSTALQNKNSDDVFALYAPEPVMFELAPPLQYVSGVNAPGKQGVEDWFATFQGPIGYAIRDLYITVGGDVAYCHSLNRMTGTKTDGTNVDLWFRETYGLRKIGGAWKIAHQHQSVPFYMDGSYKAAIDLKP